MAKAKKAPRGEKSQAIRDYLATNKNAKAAEVVSALGEKGITVSAPMVYNLMARKKMGKRRGKARAGGKTVSMSITHLVAAKKLADQVGVDEVERRLQRHPDRERGAELGDLPCERPCKNAALGREIAHP